MVWEKPHISKIYEALTALADSRIELLSPQKAKCYSSSDNKFYEIEYDPKSDSIISNDNSAFYTGSLSYPMIAFLMLTGRIAYEKKLERPLSGIHWKDINQKFNNDYDSAVDYVLSRLKDKGVSVDFVRDEIGKIYKIVCSLKLNHLGEKRLPPKGY